MFPQCTELGSSSYIVQYILKELNLFLPSKVFVHWTRNYNVFKNYLVSKWALVPSVLHCTNYRMLDCTNTRYHGNVYILLIRTTACLTHNYTRKDHIDRKRGTVHYALLAIQGLTFPRSSVLQMAPRIQTQNR
jgi:hypothetical protein